MQQLDVNRQTRPNEQPVHLNLAAEFGPDDSSRLTVDPIPSWYMGSCTAEFAAARLAEHFAKFQAWPLDLLAEPQQGCPSPPPLHWLTDLFEKQELLLGYRLVGPQRTVHGYLLHVICPQLPQWLRLLPQELVALPACTGRMRQCLVDPLPKQRFVGA